MVASGCGFRVPQSGPADSATTTDAATDAAPDTSSILPDAPADAAPDATAACQVGVASATGTDRGRVGADNGGDNFGPLACTGNDRIVGVDVRVSDQNTIYNGRSIHGFQILCAPVTIMPGGTAQVGTVTPVEVMGTGGFMWSPSTLSQPTRCPDGSIVTGLVAHSGADDNRFLDVTMTCKSITISGTIGGAATTIHVNGSLTDTNHAYQKSCNANEILVTMPNRTGAGIDSLNLFCSAPTCL